MTSNIKYLLGFTNVDEITFTENKNNYLIMAYYLQYMKIS